MKKIVFLICIFFSFLYAGLVDGIAVVVNEKPITLYEIDELMLKTNKSKDEAVKTLIDKRLYDEELENKKIEVDIFDVNEYISKLAAANGMDVINFKSVIRQQYKDYDKFIEDIKKD